MNILNISFHIFDVFAAEEFGLPFQVASLVLHENIVVKALVVSNEAMVNYAALIGDSLNGRWGQSFGQDLKREKRNPSKEQSGVYVFHHPILSQILT